MALNLKQKISLIRNAENNYLTLETVKNLLEVVYPKLHEDENYELCLELQTIESRIRARKKQRNANLIKNAGLSTTELRKLLNL